MSLIDNGWVLKEKIVSLSEIAQLLSELNLDSKDQTAKTIVIDKKFYKQSSIVTLTNTIKQESNKFDNYNGLKLSKIWFVNSSFENSNTGELPYVPHFDRRRFLKIMLYLTDVGESDGPFTTSNYHVERLEEQRKKIKRFTSGLKENTYIEDLEYNFIHADAGDCIIFDTNCPHFASPVGKEGNRKILRLDFERNDWNRHLNSFARNLLQRAKS